MLIRFQPIRFFPLSILVISAMGLLAFGSAMGQPYDWQVSDGPYGGEVFALAQAPNGDVYAGAWNKGGVFRSTDQGLHWQEVGLHGYGISEIVINSAGTIFAARNNGDVHRSLDNGTSWQLSGSTLVGFWGSLAYDQVLDILYAARREICSRSVDGGDTWQTVDTAFPNVIVTALAVVPNGGSLFVGTESDKVFRSDDGGVTWYQFADGMSPNRVDDLLVVPEGQIYAAGYGGGILRADLNGTTWTHLNQGLGSGFCQAVGRDPGGNLWAGTVQEGPYVSFNGGLNWAAARTGLEHTGIWDFLFLGPSEFLIACQGSGVYGTDNGGSTWEPSHWGINQSSVKHLLNTGNGNLYVATFGSGVHRSTDGGVTWDPINTGIEDLNGVDIVSHPDGDLFCGTWWGHVYRSTNGGDTWSPTGSTPNIIRVGCLAVKPSSGDLFVGGDYENGVWRSPDKGNTWFPANSGIEDIGLRQLVVEDEGDLLVVTWDDGIFRSENDGDSWFPLNNGLPVLSLNQVLSLPGGVLFCAINGHGLHRSLDDGANWDLVDSSLAEVYITTVAANPNGYIFAGSGNDGIVYQSTDGGDTWFDVSGWFPGVRLSDLAFNDNGQLLAGTHGFGVIYTDQTTPVQLRGLAAERSPAGSVTMSWSLPDAPPHLIMDVYRSVAGAERERLTSEVLAGGPDFSFVDAAASAEACEYWLCLTDSYSGPSWYGPVSVDKADLFITRLAIESIWPNPARGSTTIRYAVPLRDNARLDVYDLRGRLVRQLNQGAGETGTLEAVWDARDDRGSRVASGTYFLRLQTESRMMTGKVVVLGDRR